FVKGIFNSIIDAVNGVIGGINQAAKIAGDALGMDLQLGYIPRLAAGALIPAQPGGVLANIGEGRHDEVVMPLAGPVLDRIRAALLGDGSAGMQKILEYHAAPNQSFDAEEDLLTAMERAEALGW